MGCLRVHTGKERGREYPGEVALSVHFSWSRDGLSFEPLNRGYGILFAEASERADGGLDVRMLDEPAIFRSGAAYRIAARLLGSDGRPIPEASGRVLLWRSPDLVEFEFLGLVERAEAEGLPDSPGAEIQVDDEVLSAAVAAWSPIPVDEPFSECASPFPLAEGHADPVFFPWQGRWLYAYTNDANGNIGFRVRAAESPRGVFAPGVAERVILDRDEGRGLVQTFWAPEFHLIGGRLCLLFAVGGSEWGPQCHLMRLAPGGDALEAADWEAPVRVLRGDGSPLAPGGISLDMTPVETPGGTYLAWSQRWNIGKPNDSGSMLAIARADPDEPWRLASEPVGLSRPLYGWENQSGTINNEGPFALYHDGAVHLAYAAGDARGYAYTIGFLSARADSDLLDHRSWRKAPTPALSSACLDGQYGPGHCSFFRDEEGRTWMAYHAERLRDRSSACAAVRRVFFDQRGRPRLDFSCPA